MGVASPLYIKEGAYGSNLAETNLAMKSTAASSTKTSKTHHHTT